eukprot:jgi/Botrbrau1/1100/Bobra.0162s0001.1
MFTRNKSYASYKGSLTTPPCSEGVTWILLTTPETISPTQVAAFQTAMASVKEKGTRGGRTNNRQLQPANNRTILNWADPKFASAASC